VLAVDLLAPALPETDADDDNNKDDKNQNIDDAYAHGDSL
jgi:hypothetical protein